MNDKYKRSPICDELEKLNLSEKTTDEVKSKTEEAIEQIEGFLTLPFMFTLTTLISDKMSKIDSIREKTEDASLGKLVFCMIIIIQ